MTAEPVDQEPSASADRAWSGWRAHARALTPADFLLLSWTAAMCIGHLTFFAYSSWTARVVVMLVLLPYGAVQFVRLVARRERGALAWSGFLAVLIVSALMSAAPRVALIGVGGSSQSAAFFMGLACVWAAGRFASRQARRFVEPVLIGCLGLHLLVGVVQVGFGISSGPLATFPGRASGLAENPVYFGALMALGAVLCAWHLYLDRSWSWTVALVLAVAGVSLSGSRVAFVSCLVVMFGVALARRPVLWRQVVAGAAAGSVAAYLYSRVVGARTSLERVATSGDDGRWDVWGFGVQAFLDRPFLGWGPDRFRTAIQGHVSDAFVIQNDAVGKVGWTDPHSLPLGIAVGSGILGLVALGILVVVLARTTGGPLAAAAGAIVLTWLLQPLFIVTAPIAALLLGMAVKQDASAAELREQGVRRDVGLGLVALGVLLAGTVAVADLRVVAADSLSETAAAWRWYWRDPVVADDLADSFTLASFQVDPGFAEDAIEWSERAVDYQPNRAVWWARLASRHLILGDDDAARAAAERAVELQANEPQAWVVLKSVAREMGDADLEQQADERVCTLLPTRC